jgi:hypothetical protein
MIVSSRFASGRFQPGSAAIYACTGALPSPFAICGLPPVSNTGFLRVLVGLAVALMFGFGLGFAFAVGFALGFAVALAFGFGLGFAFAVGFALGFAVALAWSFALPLALAAGLVVVLMRLAC